MDIEKYYLDFNKISSLSEGQQEKVHAYYNTLINYEGFSKKAIESVFNTLYYNGYLVTARETKLNSLL